MNTKTIFGIIAFSSTVIYLILEKKKPSGPSLEGVEVKINPQKLVDGALAMSDINPTAKDGIKQLTQSVLKKIYEK